MQVLYTCIVFLLISETYAKSFAGTALGERKEREAVITMRGLPTIASPSPTPAQRLPRNQTRLPLLQQTSCLTDPPKPRRPVSSLDLDKQRNYEDWRTR